MVNNFRAGSLSEHTEFWSTLTTDYKTSKVISTGIEIELHELPKQSCPPRQYQFTTTESAYIRSEIHTLLKKNVITVVKHCQGEYLSNVFLRPKKDGKFRMILNLKDFNKSVVYHHFKMTTLKSAIKLITKNCYMATLDWKDAWCTNLTTT